jgi:hypothetical protein
MITALENRVDLSYADETSMGYRTLAMNAEVGWLPAPLADQNHPYYKKASKKGDPRTSSSLYFSRHASLLSTAPSSYPSTASSAKKFADLLLLGGPSGSSPASVLASPNS